MQYFSGDVMHRCLRIAVSVRHLLIIKNIISIKLTKLEMEDNLITYKFYGIDQYLFQDVI